MEPFHFDSIAGKDIAGLFWALVQVESRTRLLAQETARVQAWRKANPEPPEFFYEGLEEGTQRSDEELFVDYGHGKVRHPHCPWLKHYDGYASLRAKWRGKLEQAKVAAAGAAVLDRPDQAPLERTSVAVLRDIQRLGGSLPLEIVDSADPPSGETLPARLMEGRAKISHWVDELKLLLPPPGAVDADPAPRADPEWEALDADCQAVMQALLESDAVPDGARLGAARIADKALGTTERTSASKRLKTLEAQGYVDSKRGRGGGWALTERGLTLARRNVTA